MDALGLLDQTLPESLIQAGPFDFILCTEVLEHVFNWPAAFRNLASILSPGGRLLVTTPHFYPLHEVPYDYWRPTPYAIERAALDNDLQVCHVESLGDGWDVLGTFLGETRCRPATSGVIGAISTLVGKGIRKIVEKAAASAWVRRHVHLRSPYFLSCLAVLQRPAE